MTRADDVREHPIVFWGAVAGFFVLPFVVSGLLCSVMLWNARVAPIHRFDGAAGALLTAWALVMGFTVVITALVVGVAAWNWVFGLWFDHNERAYYEALTDDATVLPADVWKDET